MVITTPERRHLYDELARRTNAMIGSAPPNAQGALMHLPVLTSPFTSPEGTECSVLVRKPHQDSSVFDVVVDLGIDNLTEQDVAEAKEEMQQRLHGTVTQTTLQGFHLNLRYDSTPDIVYMAWAEQAKSFIDTMIGQDGIQGRRDTNRGGSVVTTQGREQTNTSVRVARRMGELGFTVKFEPARKRCLPNGKPWTEDGAIAALKHCLPDAYVISVFDHTSQQVIATVTTAP